MRHARKSAHSYVFWGSFVVSQSCRLLPEANIHTFVRMGPICIWMCWTPTCDRVQVVLSSGLFRYTDADGFLGSWIRGNHSPRVCSVCLNGWKRVPSKCPSVETGSPLPFLDLALEERVLDESSRKFGVRFSTFRKKLNIHSYVPGDSDHHP